MNPVRLAIIGSGGIAQTHAAAIALIPEARLTAVCSRNPASAATLAGPAGARIFDTPEELAAWDGADAVLIATPSGAHEEGALPSIRAGKHVLCEKPLEISTDRVRRMVAEAEKAGVTLAGFFPMRCGAAAMAIRAALDAGRFGRLTFLSARVKWWRDQAYYSASSWRGTQALDGGGALMNQGIHAVDLLQWFGGRPRETMAYAATLAHEGLEVEDTLTASVRFENGALGTIEAATACHPGLDLTLDVCGDGGTATLVSDRLTFWQFREELPGDEAIRSGASGGKFGSGASDPRAISCEGHRRQIADFLAAIRGEATKIPDGREAGVAVAVVESIYRSAKSGKSESVEYP